MQACNNSNKSNSGSEGGAARTTRITPGSIARPTRASTIDDSYKYERIIEILKECDPDDWESYLAAFKNEKLTDATLKLIPCDATNDSEAMWKELIPQIGIRLAFKKQWSEENRGDGMATPGVDTPGRTSPGMTIKYEGQGNESEQDIDEAVLGHNTRDMDLAEPECEGNETKFDDPVVPGGGDADDDG